MRALGFCVSVPHAIFMAEQFEKLGFKATHLSGDHDPTHRAAVLAQLKAGDLHVVFSVDVLGEGVDVPDVDTLLLLRPTQSPVLFAQQIGRGLRTADGKTRCLILDFIGQHHAEYRLEQRFSALLDPVHGSVRSQAEREFPFLPAGCELNLEPVARDRVLAALKAVTAKPGLTGLKKDLAALESPTLEAFLASSGRTVEQFYAADRRQMSWTRLRRLVQTTAAPPEHTGRELREEEAQLLKRIGYFQHVADRQRVNTWFDWLTSAEPPDPNQFTTGEERLAIVLFHLLTMTPSTIADGFAQLWRHPAAREELAELLTLSHADLDAVPIPLLGLADVPLMAHARYTRAEVFAALGVSTAAKPKEHREGVYFVSDSKTQLMFVTLHKDEARFTSSVQYKDHALSADLFRWETPNNWRQQSPSTQRCAGLGPDASRHRLLFVRERSSGPIEGAFRCFGQVDLTGDLEGDRPVALTWRLHQPLPEIVFESTSLIAAS
jgi:hypothetical protein